MKKLICANDIEELVANGEKEIYIDKNVIFTPSAIDIAKNNEIEIIFKSQAMEAKQENKEDKVEKKEGVTSKNVDTQQMLDLFRVIIKEGLLQDMIKQLTDENNSKFESESDCNGFKIIKGNTVKLERIETDDKDSKVYYQELISEEESKISVGFFNMEGSKFETENTNEEIFYIIDGKISIDINGKTYEANKDDVLFIPSNSSMKLESKGLTKIFYTSYSGDLINSSKDN